MKGLDLYFEKMLEAHLERDRCEECHEETHECVCFCEVCKEVGEDCGCKPCTECGELTKNKGMCDDCKEEI